MLTRESNMGAVLKLKPRSAVYKSEYFSQVVSTKEGALVITMPNDRGRLIPLPVGTLLEVWFVNGEAAPFQAEIIGRSFGGNRTITITAPGAISRGGRAEINDQSGKVLAITSGKGGVGKSTLAVNIGLALQGLGKRCCLIDVDLGTANIDVLMRLQPVFNINHLVQGEREIEEVLVRGPSGILLVPGGSGLEDVANMRERQFSRLISAFNKLESFADYLILDTGAGVSKNVINFLLAADEILLVTTPDPHAIMDAYSLIKVLSNYEVQSGIKLIVNKAEKEDDAHRVWDTVSSVSRKFLGLPVELLGMLPDSKAVSSSVRRQSPFYLEGKRGPAENVLKMAEMLSGVSGRQNEKGLSSFIQKLKEVMMDSIK